MGLDCQREEWAGHCIGCQSGLTEASLTSGKCLTKDKMYHAIIRFDQHAAPRRIREAKHESVALISVRSISVSWLANCYGLAGAAVSEYIGITRQRQ